MAGDDPAFPVVIETPGVREGRMVIPGMTIRDYFAAQAMAGVFANPNFSTKNGPEAFAQWVYDAAEAMIAERKRRYGR